MGSEMCIRDRAITCNFWLEAVSPRIQALRGPHCVPAWCDALATSSPDAMFSNEYMLRVGQTHLVKAFTFIGVPESGDDSLAALLSSLLEQAERIDNLPDSIQSSYRPLELKETKEAARDLLRSAAIDAFAQYAAAIQIMHSTPALDAERPKDFVPPAGNARVTLQTLDAAIKPMEAELTLHQAVNRRRTQPVDSSAASAVGAPSPSVASLASLAESGVSPSAAPWLNTSPAFTGSASTLGPSASEVGTPTPPHGAAYGYPPPFPMPFPPGMPPPFYAPSCVGAFSQPASAPQPPMPTGPPPQKKGSLAHTLQFAGGGVWASTSQGLRWCGAKHQGSSPFDITKACAAAVLPDEMDRELYCTRQANCKHLLRHGYTRVCSPKMLSQHELVTKKTAPDSEQTKNKKPKGKGGGRSSRGRGN